MSVLTESGRQKWVSVGALSGILCFLLSVSEIVIAVVVFYGFYDFLRFTSVLVIVILQLVSGWSTAFTALATCWFTTGYRQLDMSVRSGFLDENLCRSLLALTVPFVVNIVSMFTTGLYIVHEMTRSNLQDFRYAMTQYVNGNFYKILVDRIQTIFMCCGGKGVKDWYLYDWQGSDLLPPSATNRDRFYRGRHRIGVDWDSAPYSCCRWDAPSTCVHTQLRMYGVSTLHRQGCAGRLQDVTVIFLATSLVLFTLCFVTMVILMVAARRVQTSARAAIESGDVAAPATTWIFDKKDRKGKCKDRLLDVDSDDDICEEHQTRPGSNLRSPVDCYGPHDNDIRSTRTKPDSFRNMEECDGDWRMESTRPQIDSSDDWNAGLISNRMSLTSSPQSTDSRPDAPIQEDYSVNSLVLCFLSAVNSPLLFPTANISSRLSLSFDHDTLCNSLGSTAHWNSRSEMEGIRVYLLESFKDNELDVESDGQYCRSREGRIRWCSEHSTCSRFYHTGPPTACRGTKGLYCCGKYLTQLKYPSQEQNISSAQRRIIISLQRPTIIPPQRPIHHTKRPSIKRPIHKSTKPPPLQSSSKRPIHMTTKPPPLRPSIKLPIDTTTKPPPLRPSIKLPIDTTTKPPPLRPSIKLPIDTSTKPPPLRPSIKLPIDTTTKPPPLLPSIKRPIHKITNPPHRPSSTEPTTIIELPQPETTTTPLPFLQKDRCKSQTGQLGWCTPILECTYFQEPVRQNKMAVYLRFRCTGVKDHLFVCCPDDDSEVKQSLTGDEEWNMRTHKNRKLLNEESCGSQAQAQVIGGKTANIDEFPWLALLYYIRQMSDSLIPACGGSLITPGLVLTAAHCVSTRLSQVVLGEFDTSSKVDTYNGVTADPPQVFEVTFEDAVVHSFADIALIRLKTMAVISRFVKTICLPLDKLATENYIGEEVEVAGWGRTSNRRSKMSPTKQHVNLRIISNEQCMGISNKHINIQQTSNYGTICALGRKGEDICGGDSGGPVMITKNPRGIGQWFVIGVISFGPNDCGSQNQPEIMPSGHVRVTDYLKWILDNMEH